MKSCTESGNMKPSDITLGIISQNFEFQPEPPPFNGPAPDGALPTVAIGWTVSLADRSKVKLRGIRKRIEWQYMTPAQQYTFLANDYLNKVVNPHAESYVAHFELNKSGQVHMHMLVYISVQSLEHETYELWALRKAVNQNPTVWGLMTCKKALLRMNYIHLLKDIPEWVKYLNKDNDKSPMKPITYRRPNI